jgi:hypothetical protein
MGFPIRMNLVDIVWNSRDASTTVIDPVFHESVGIEARSDPVVVQGQVNFGVGANEALTISRSGDAARTRGRFVFKKEDIDALGFVPRKGDRVTSVAGVEHDLEITQVRYQSPLSGSFLLVYCDFEERLSAREST